MRAEPVTDRQVLDRLHLNELGTGGLIGPVVLYREK